ncbi:DUF6233 domain-containing protein [Streptomyces noursei]|uniref:DUF6233 domain-containing protein n=1 Tax=Streptomyces noursei TaxID=1971 RepID=UPI0005C84C9C|nr:DUF6233 domain-containing protein [Streptomyces noursei]
MYDLPPDLPRLRTLETWLTMTLRRVQKAIAAAEQEAVQRQPAALPPPDWVLQLDVGRDARPVVVHVGACNLAGRRARPISREQASRALTEGLEACAICRPDTELGIL